jgi:predicted transposase YbfD/YdcC
LGQVTLDEKSNEITAIPRLLEFLDVHGALVTIDAMGCQKEIAQTIIDGVGNYLLVVKDNQPHLLEDIQESVTIPLDGDGVSVEYDTFTTTEPGHGRQETRSYVVVTNLEGIRQREEWAKLQVIGMCHRERLVEKKQIEEVHYFISSRALKVPQCGEALRGHWGIENNLHWQLDVTFDEDANRVQRRPGKESLACKRYLAALDTEFLEEILAADGNPEKR